MQRDDNTTVRSGEEALDLPDDLIEGLARLGKAVAVMSPEADRRIAEAAKAHFAQRPRRAPSARRLWAMAGSLAASVLVGVLFWRTQTPVDPPTSWLPRLPAFPTTSTVPGPWTSSTRSPWPAWRAGS